VTNRTSEHYECGKGSPGRARRFCREVLRRSLGDDSRSREVIDDAELVVSELMTNAIDADCGDAELTVTVATDGAVRIEVEDDALGLPQEAVVPSIAQRGRGLALVAALSIRWGYEEKRRGKRVWAELPARRAALSPA
jgi:anti-sigma regulatory factor (Ser/Thr protein kinase)